MKNLITALTMGLAISTANAGTIVCDGKVLDLGMHANDKLMLRLDSMNKPVIICNLQSTSNAGAASTGAVFTTGPETCKAHLANFLAAKQSGESVGNVWFDGDDVPATCDSWDSWQSANIRHYMF